MALAQIVIMANIVEGSIIGHQRVSLTEFASGLEPEIAQGSLVEVGGALFEAAADEAITGLGAIANNNQIYIKLTVAGASVTVSGTLVVPTWDTTKQGFYIGAERVIGGMYKDSGGNYTLKWLYEHVGNSNLKLFGDGTVGVWDGLGFLVRKVVEIGDWNMASGGAVYKDVAHGITDFKKIRGVSAMIRNDADTAYYPLNAVAESASSVAGGAFSIGATNIRLNRSNSGVFFSSSFDSTSYNRGWVLIEYEV